MFTINVYQKNVVKDSVEVFGCEAAWDQYQFYRMAFPVAMVTMVDEKTGGIIVSTTKGGE